MPTLKRSTNLAICFAAILSLSCAKTDKEATDAAGSGDPSVLTAADLTGRWNLVAVPFSGDTTPTTSTLNATSDNSGWTLTFPNRAPLETRVTFEGDSVMTDTGPYESVRRKGVQVRTTGVFRLEGGTIVGSSTARYAARGVDSVMRFRVTGTRAP